MVCNAGEPNQKLVSLNPGHGQITGNKSVSIMAIAKVCDVWIVHEPNVTKVGSHESNVSFLYFFYGNRNGFGKAGLENGIRLCGHTKTNQYGWKFNRNGQKPETLVRTRHPLIHYTIGKLIAAENG